jgi:hypothetical protein
MLIATLASTACRKQTSVQPAGASPTPVAQEAPVGGVTQVGDKYFFRGTIANLSIEMQLLREASVSPGRISIHASVKTLTEQSIRQQRHVYQADESENKPASLQVADGRESPDPSIRNEGKWSKPDGSRQTEFMVTQQPYRFTGNVQVTAKVIKEANKQKLYSVNAEYPQIDGDSRFDGFNKEARALINKDVAAFKTSETSGDAAGPSDVPAETQTSTLEAGYDFHLANDNLISIAFTEGTYSRGAAHGNSLTQVLNYDVKGGKKIALADLFKDKSKYLSVIASYCQKELKDRARKPDSLILEDIIDTGVGPRADNYRAWNITTKGLWITFDPYQVAASAAGPQHILVPYSILKDIIKPEGPIAMYANQ